jgi:hypothetical protein
MKARKFRLPIGRIIVSGALFVSLMALSVPYIAYEGATRAAGLDDPLGIAGIAGIEQAEAALIPGGTLFVPGCAGAKTVDIPGASLSTGAKTQIYDINYTGAQKFRLLPAGDGYYYIQNINSNLVLDVQYAQTSDGTPVWQYPLNYTDAQKWGFYSVQPGSGWYFMRSKLDYNMCLDVAGAGTANGTPVHLWTYNGTRAQQFCLVQVPDISY